MATSVMEAQPRGSLEFVESSVLEAVVPAHPDVDIKDEVESWDGVIENEKASVLPALAQRHVLLLGRVTLPTLFRQCLTHAQASR